MKAVAGWIFPGVLLAIVSKCPACLAVYIALGTGIGLSVSAAAEIRALVMLFAAALFVLAAVRAGRSRANISQIQCR